jgi:hypothetical protein
MLDNGFRWRVRKQHGAFHHHRYPEHSMGLSARLGLLCALLVILGLWTYERSASPRDSAAGPLSQSPRSPHETQSRRRPYQAQTAIKQPHPANRIVGTVRSTQGDVLPEASVCTLGAENRCCALSQCTVTDKNGRFELWDPPSDVDAIVASASGYLSRLHRFVESSPEGTTSRSITIALDSGGAEVSGSVVDVTGGPVPFALLTVSSSTVQFPTIITANSDGKFSVYAQEAEIEIVAQAEAYSQTVRRLRAPARNVILGLSPGARIIGRVIDAETGEPVSNVTVKARAVASADPATPIVSTSKSDGTFEIVGLTGGTTYRLDATSTNRRSASHVLRADVSQTSDPLVLTVFPAAMLTGTVERAGVPCPGASVTAAGLVSTTARATSSGMVQLEGLLPGNYRITIRCPESLVYREEIAITPTPIVREWAVQPGLSVTGRVENQSGQPVVGAVVSIVAVGYRVTNMGSTCDTAANGSFTCFGLSPGDYDCSVEDAGDPTRELVRVSLGEGSIADILLRTRPSGAIHVALTVPSGAPQLPFKVFARGPGGLPVEGIPRQSGFAFEQMPLGRYDVYAEVAATGVEAVLEYDGQVIDVELTAPSSVWSIAGVVTDEAGSPLVDAWVRASPSDPLAQTQAAMPPATLTNEVGRFAFSGLHLTKYDLHATSDVGEGSLRNTPAGSIAAVVRINPQIDVAVERPHLAP